MVDDGSDRLRALFVNEGELGAGIMGHPRTTASIRSGLAGRDDVEAEFAELPPMGNVALEFAARSVPVLGRLDLDLQSVRWHAVQAVRTRRFLQTALASARPDVLHVHTHSITLGSVDLLHRVPTFLSMDATIWDWHELSVWRRARPWSRTLLRPLLRGERRALEAARAVLAFTAWSQRAAQRVAPRAHVVEHHPGIELDVFHPAERTPRSALRVLFVGGRFPQKGGLDLLAALRPRLGKDVELDLVTPANVRAEPGVTVHRLASGDPRLAELHRQADVFCLPTYADANPWAIIEAMASGTPVVSTDVGGIRELLDDGRAGRLVPAGDVAALREALAELLADERARRALAEAGRACCELRYDCRRQTAELLELIRRWR